MLQEKINQNSKYKYLEYKWKPKPNFLNAKIMKEILNLQRKQWNILICLWNKLNQIQNDNKKK